jgi:soluble cytochrome b562
MVTCDAFSHGDEFLASVQKNADDIATLARAGNVEAFKRASQLVKSCTQCHYPH